MMMVMNASGILCRAGLCRGARQADRGLSGETGRGLDLRPHYRYCMARSTATSTSRGECRWSSPTTTSRGPSPFCGRSPTTATIPNLTPEQIGNTWLNYLIERRTILWWGGIGNSTEHTAYLAVEERHPGAGERVNRAQRHDGCRADRLPDLHRRLGHDRAGRSGARRRLRPPCRERQSRRRGDLRSAGDRGHGGAGVRRVRSRPAHRRRRQPDPRRFDDRPAHRRHPGVARGRARLAEDAGEDRGQLRLRQVHRQLSHGAEPRPDHHGAALRRRRLSASR